MNNLDLNIISDISGATEYNDHTGALLNLAHALGNEMMIRELNWIDECHDFAGSMSTDLLNDRGAIAKILMKQAKSTYTNYLEIYAAF